MPILTNIRISNSHYFLDATFSSVDAGEQIWYPKFAVVSHMALKD